MEIECVCVMLRNLTYTCKVSTLIQPPNAPPRTAAYSSLLCVRNARPSRIRLTSPDDRPETLEWRSCLASTFPTLLPPPFSGLGISRRPGNFPSRSMIKAHSVHLNSISLLKIDVSISNSTLLFSSFHGYLRRTSSRVPR